MRWRGWKNRENEYTLQSHERLWAFSTIAVYVKLAFAPFLPSHSLTYFPVTSLARISFSEILTVDACAAHTAMYLQHAAARHLSVYYRLRRIGS
jgi:hypothetical protein